LPPIMCRDCRVSGTAVRPPLAPGKSRLTIRSPMISRLTAANGRPALERLDRRNRQKCGYGQNQQTPASAETKRHNQPRTIPHDLSVSPLCSLERAVPAKFQRRKFPSAIAVGRDCALTITAIFSSRYADLFSGKLRTKLTCSFVSHKKWELNKKSIFQSVTIVT